jgi:ribosomal-protein-alanine N-acetyltransferase
MIARAASPLGDGLSSTLAGLHALAFAGRDRVWTAPEIAEIAASPGVAVLTTTAGFGMVRVVVDEGELLTLAVAPDARGRGVGAALLTACEDAARGDGATALFLEVAADNDAALRLYTRAGMGAVGRRRAYYTRPAARPVDALLLRKPL